jgi:3',5'-cyclic AMP phosphodiesterase CpdA
MGLRFKFAIASDLHIALPHTIWDSPYRFHLVELSISTLEAVLSHLGQLDLDFLLLPGDLTQHGEPENHAWLANRLANLPYPVYVIPGNHDVPTIDSLDRFAPHYTQFGYQDRALLYYDREIVPGVHLIGLNSNHFDRTGCQIGWVDREQLDWLESVLSRISQDRLVLVMVHHNILEHMPGQARNPLGKRYMLGNAERLCELLHQARVKLVFTGHLHVQDIAKSDCFDLYDITTGSLVSYPHPYRVLTYERDESTNSERLSIQSYRVDSIPEQPELQHFSREWMGDRSHLFMLNLLTKPPLNLPIAIAETMTPHLRYFWASIANGDAEFSFPNFPAPARAYFEAFSDRPPSDNDAILHL